MMIELPLVLMEVTEAPAMFDPIGGNELISVMVPKTPGPNVIVLLPVVVLALRIA